MRRRLEFALAALLAAQAVAAQPALEAALNPPEGARVLLDAAPEAQIVVVPIRPATGGAAPADAFEGVARWRSFALEGGGAPLAQARRLRDALASAGFETVLDCAAEACGGFAFLSAIELLPPPDMLVNLADFHQLTMRRAGPSGGEVVVSALFSRLGGRLHGQIVDMATGTAAPPPLRPHPDDASAPTSAGGDLGAELDARGFAALDGLDFVAGSAEIAAGGDAILDAAAAALAARPALAVAVVGHTDGSGGLAANLDVSRARAEAVRAALIDRGIDAARLSAEGAGWLAPRASNAHDAGRAANRRVELVAR